MTVASSLFYSSNDTEKQTLLRRISPSDEQFDEQKDRWNDLADFLIDDLGTISGYTIKTWLQGSYKFATQVRPVVKWDEFDIDLGVYFEWSGKASEGRYTPKELREMVQTSLKKYASLNMADVQEVTKPKPRCCRIRYHNSFHIDVPVYHLNPDKDLRSLATDDEWENSDPKKIYFWFRDGFDDLGRAKARRFIKYIKAWAALKFRSTQGRPSSILLTVLIVDAINNLGINNISSDDDGVRDIVEQIIDRLEEDAEVENPVDRSENLARLTEAEMANFIAKLRTLLDTATRATSQSTEANAADVWQEAFEHLFPFPEIDESIYEQKNAMVPVSMPEIKVSAIGRGNSSFRSSSMNEIGPIPKDCDITFEVANYHLLPSNAEIFWMVRNEGREAELTNDLGHRAGTGRVIHENSAYSGRHFMDCVVKVNGRTVAVRRVPVTITGNLMPRRNPISQPAWRQFARRR